MIRTAAKKFWFRAQPTLWRYLRFQFLDFPVLSIFGLVQILDLKAVRLWNIYSGFNTWGKRLKFIISYTLDKWIVTKTILYDLLNNCYILQCFKQNQKLLSSLTVTCLTLLGHVETSWLMLTTLFTIIGEDAKSTWDA